MVKDRTAPCLWCAQSLGDVCCHMMEFFSREENHYQSNKVAYNIKMLKETGTADDAEDDGSVMRDALAELWDTCLICLRLFCYCIYKRCR